MPSKHKLLGDIGCLIWKSSIPLNEWKKEKEINKNRGVTKLNQEISCSTG